MIVISQISNKCLNVCEWVEVVEWNRKDGPLPSPVALWIVSVCEENPDRKKNNFVEKLAEDDGTTMFFIAEKQEKIIQQFSLDSLIIPE